MDINNILRSLPKMDVILGDSRLGLIGAKSLLRLATQVLDDIREKTLNGEITEIPLFDDIINKILQAHKASFSRVINATGVVLHTNLGRAPMAKAAVQAALDVAECYTDLEYDLATGKRGSRLKGLDQLLCTITGAEAGLAVNNNAAAVLLTLSALCAGREVIVSRGELVEIGGAFRVPEVISQGGAILREVGTTNCTRLSDYEKAINPNTAAIIKIHTSNYKVVGYTQEVDISELSHLAMDHNIPLIYDLGGGSLVQVSNKETTVQQVIGLGADDIVCFSGDKLLGGPQAGIIVGKKNLIEKIRKHPLYRALRMDKMSLAALCATLSLYEDEEKAKREIPILAMLTTPLEDLKAKAERLLAMLPSENGATIEPCESQAGGGSLPEENFQSYAITIEESFARPLFKLEKLLRDNKPPIITRIYKEKLLLDVRTINEADFSEIAHAFAKIFNMEGKV